MLYRSTIFAFCILAICCKLSAQETICAVDIGNKSCQQKCGDYPVVFNVSCPGNLCFFHLLNGYQCQDPITENSFPIDQEEWGQQRPSYRAAGPNEQGFLTLEKYLDCFKKKRCVVCKQRTDDKWYCDELGDFKIVCRMETPEWIRQNNARIACPPEL